MHNCHVHFTLWRATSTTQMRFKLPTNSFNSGNSNAWISFPVSQNFYPTKSGRWCFFFTDCAGHPNPPLFLPALSLYLFIFDLMALWRWRGALHISNYPLNCWTWSACDISPWQKPFQGVCKWTLVSLLKAMMSMDVPSQGMSLQPTMITWVRFIHESSSFHP